MSRAALALALTLVLAAVSAGTVPARQTASPASGRWYKGNTHSHTLNSDGDSTPDEVVRWYREHGYAFVVITDHNYLTSVDGLNALHGADEKFLVIRGEEVSTSFAKKAVHVNGLNGSARVGTQTGNSILEVLQNSVDNIRRVNGIPHVNHPNFQWALTRDDLQQLRNYRHVEIYNGHPQVNNLGGGGVPGMEEVWDALLSSGKMVYGVAVDDAHTFKDPANPNLATPGRAWIAVRAPRLETAAIMNAFDRGDFYASTGVELTDYHATPKRIAISVNAPAFSKYRIQFIGKGGRLLKEVLEPAAVYEPRGDEGYVRTRVLESNGRMAWCQPILVGG
jgi:hypothetical protein